MIMIIIPILTSHIVSETVNPTRNRTIINIMVRITNRANIFRRRKARVGS